MNITGITGNVYMLQAMEPYTRSNGTSTELRVWQSHCVDCGAPFIVKTPGGIDVDASSPRFARQRCGEHKTTWNDLMARGQMASRKLTDDDVAQIRAFAAAGSTYAALSLVFPASAGTIREIVRGRRR